MKVYRQRCLACEEPWLYVRLTDREAELLCAEIAYATKARGGRIAPRVRFQLDALLAGARPAQLPAKSEAR